VEFDITGETLTDLSIEIDAQYMIDGATSSTPLKGDRFGRKDTGQSIIE
jgi:hypothetical protein